MDAWLTKVVRDSLEQNLIKNATFIGERLYASYPTEARDFVSNATGFCGPGLILSRTPQQANAYLLGTCYFRGSQFHRVVEALQGERCRSLRAGDAEGQELRGCSFSAQERRRRQAYCYSGRRSSS